MLGSLSYAITATTAPLNQKLNEAKQSMATTDKTMKSTGKSIADSSKKMSQSAGAAIAPMQQGLSAINPAAGSAVQGMQSMSMAARGLNAALGPVGLAIGALGAAIAALTSYFKGSVDGQEKMAEIMGYLQGVAMYLKDRFIELGRWIVKAFEDPQQAVKDLWEIIKQNMINRFQGMIKMVQAGWEVISKGANGAALAVKGIFDKDAREESKKYFQEAGDAMEDFGKAAAQIATGIVEPFQKISDVFSDINNKGKELQDLNEREIKLRQRIADESVKVAKIDAEIAENRRIANDDQQDLNRQIEAMAKATALVEQKNKILLSQKQEELAIQIARNKAGESNIDDIEAQRKLEVEILELKRSQDNELRTLLRRQATLINQKETEGKVTQKALEEEKQAREEILEEIRKAGLTEIEQIQETMQAKLDAFEWSEAEQLKIREHYQGMIDALREKEIADEEKAKQEILNTVREASMSEVELMRERMNQMLEAHEWTEEERYNITKYWNDKIAEYNDKTTDEITEKYKQLAQVAGGAMAGLFNELGAGFAGAEVSFQSYVSSMLDGLQQIINGLLAQAIAGMIAGEAKKGLRGLIFASIGIGALKAMWASNVPKMATGGVVPPGYSGDTYPAMLSSGETVLPPDRLPEFGFGASKVKFKIEGRDLVGILDEQSNINYNF